MLSRRSVPLLALGLGLLALSASSHAAPARLTVEGAPFAPVRAAAPMTLLLHPPFDMRGALRKLPTSLDAGPVVRLSIERVKAPAGASIRVFINYPTANADTPTSDFHYVGNLTSFEDPAAGSPGDDFLLDAGRAFKRLSKGDRLLPGENVAVTFVLVPESAGTDMTIPIERVVLSVENTPGQ